LHGRIRNVNKCIVHWKRTVRGEHRARKRGCHGGATRAHLLLQTEVGAWRAPVSARGTANTRRAAAAADLTIAASATACDQATASVGYWAAVRAEVGAGLRCAHRAAIAVHTPWTALARQPGAAFTIRARAATLDHVAAAVACRSTRCTELNARFCTTAIRTRVASEAAVVKQDWLAAGRSVAGPPVGSQRRVGKYNFPVATARHQKRGCNRQTRRDNSPDDFPLEHALTVSLEGIKYKSSFGTRKDRCESIVRSVRCKALVTQSDHRNGGPSSTGVATQLDSKKCYSRHHAIASLSHSTW
jgi:hypothetical protein